MKYQMIAMRVGTKTAVLYMKCSSILGTNRSRTLVYLRAA